MNNAARRGVVDFIRVRIEPQESGLFIATSPDMSGLHLAHGDKSALIEEIPKALEALYQVEFGIEVRAYPARLPADDRETYPCSWATVPAHIAAESLPT